MTNNVNLLHSTLEKILSYAKERFDQESFPLFATFIQLYYSNMPLEDLKGRAISDLYGVVLNHWYLMQIKKPKELKIHVFNPNYETHGWQSTHTIIQVVAKDMPFLVDSIRMEITRLNFTIYLTIHSGGIKVKREKNQLIDISPFHAPRNTKYSVEAPIHLEIDRQTDPKVFTLLEENLRRVLNDTRLAVEDWAFMQARADAVIADLEKIKTQHTPSEIQETETFLVWLLRDHFTFLGYRYYEVVGEGAGKALQLVPNSGLGVLRDHSNSRLLRSYAEMPKSVRDLALAPKPILFTAKTNTRSTVHRPGYTDLICIKQFNNKKELMGEHRFIGLYTSSVYRGDPRSIPLLRRKVDSIIKKANLPMRSHSAKDLIHILTTLPRDDLFHAPMEELYEIALGILHMQGRRRVRLFIRKDVYGRYFSCLVYLPRENFNTDLVLTIEEILKKTLHGSDITFETQLDESLLARIHYIVRLDAQEDIQFDIDAIEKKIAEAAKSWQDGFRESMLDYFGEEQGNLIIAKYRHAFPAGYREVFEPQHAIYDILYIEKLSNENSIEMSFYRPLGAANNVIRFKLYHPNVPIPLFDALPMLENMGLRIISEQAYPITLKNRQVWIIDFSMTYIKEPTFIVEAIKPIFQEAFQKIWLGEAENDAFNRLVLEAGLTWREVTILRAYTKYFRQIRITYSEQYIATTLINNPHIATLLIKLFYCLFDPNIEHNEEDKTCIDLENEILQSLEAVNILDEDRILRRFVNVILATLRTNYFQLDAEFQPHSYLTFKFKSKKIMEMPKPTPLYGVYIYSTQFEGVHIRSAKVARGGIRWSDRPEDFRTEIVGLMKAQIVKNALIVPSGAKGGFVPKTLPAENTRDAIMQMGIACYENYIRALLDITDNIEFDRIVHPPQTVCYDGDDPYLVVAADKGTATFSDIANRLSIEKNYWLSDAFASGGSTGYDHKKMGITARGAWVSACRHFQELNINIETTKITVVGIGDMSGDVFGNGMLLSQHLCLVAAFNDKHIFLDPNPDTKLSYAERLRLFNLSRSTWDDYNRDLISKGGGVYSRSVKIIRLTPEVQEILKTKKEAMDPAELIQTILKAPVDMIWNGGIGTYVKSSQETHNEVSDRSNDALRVNGEDLRARVVCEGGNLGFTQLGRIEYEFAGGKINTDFIDNSGGVDCSDHEVNIKVLLNTLVRDAKLTRKQRDQLLIKMTGEVRDLVLQDNYQQNLAISIAALVTPKYIDSYERYINEQSKNKKIDRDFEFLPDEKTLTERRINGKGLTRPELAILFSYSKIILKKEIKRAELIFNDPFLTEFLFDAFPSLLKKRYREALKSHYLARDIIATQLSNRMVFDMGITFVYQIKDETGASILDIVRAYVAAIHIFNIAELQRMVESLDYRIKTEIQYEMLLQVTRLIRRATRWFLRNYHRDLNIQIVIAQFAEPIKNIVRRLPKLLLGADKQTFNDEVIKLTKQDVPLEIAERIASLTPIYDSLNIIGAAGKHHVEIFRVSKLYFMLIDRLDLFWFRNQIDAYPAPDRWALMARAAYRSDLDWIQRQLIVSVVLDTKARSIPGKINEWLEKNKDALNRWQEIIAGLRSTSVREFAILFVAIRVLLDLARARDKLIIHNKESGQDGARAQR